MTAISARRAMTLALEHARSSDPDSRTSLADARIAYCIASGVPIDRIDPAQGWNATDDAYRTVRAQWAEIVTTRKPVPALLADWHTARDTWTRLRPDLVGDWPKWEDTRG